MTAYINVTRFWTEADDLVPAEIQVEAQPDEDSYTSPDATALQVFSHDNGGPISGQIVLDPDQLAALYTAIGERLVGLGRESVAG